MIRGYVDVNNRWIEDLEEIEEEVKTYFQNLFTSTNPSPPIIEVSLKGIIIKLLKRRINN